MNNINDIDFSLYSLYAFTDQKKPFKTEVRIDSGYINFTAYDSFEIDSGTILCFKDDSFSGFHDLKITGQKIDFIQLTNIKNILNDVLNEKDSTGYNFYLFLDSVVQDEPYIFDDSWDIDGFEQIKNITRCDYKKLGGSGFYIGRSGYSVTNTYYVLSVTGIGHILKIETSNEGNLNQGTQAEYAASRTFAGMIKLLHEWSIVHKQPFNNKEKISKSASLFLENLNLNEDIMSDIISSTGDMVLARYIKGDTVRSAEKELQSMYEMPESFKDYIKKHYSYQNLYDLNKNLNLNIFNNSLIDKYKNYLESILFDFFYMNGIDVEKYKDLEEISKSDISTVYIKDIISLYNSLDDLVR